MKRFLHTLKLDVTVQWRNKLYAIGIGIAAVIAGVFSQAFDAEMLPYVVPVVMLMIIGGTTLMYVAGMILFERDEGTISATIVSPLRTGEYIWSKILTLTLLTTAEATVMIGGTMLVLSFSETVPLPNLPVLISGVLAIGMVFTLIGIILVVRFHSITDFLIPMAALTVPLQLPFLHFLGVIEHPLFLLIPTSAQMMMMRASFSGLSSLEWVYCIGYSVVTISVLTIWARRAFHTHIVMRAG
jgi:fluoroquinolone transport system permease protein